MSYATNSFMSVYENPRRLSPGIRTLQIPIVRQLRAFEITEGHPIDSHGPEILELNKYRCSMHISYEYIGDMLNFKIDVMASREEYTSHLTVLAGLLNAVCRETQDRLGQTQPIEEGHPVIIERVMVSSQIETSSFIVELEFWAVQHQDCDLGRQVFERTLHQMLNRETIEAIDTGSFINPLPHLDPYTFHRQGYDINAEENAHELLKGMLTKKQFELYKNEGYVVVKGTYGRTYKVNKNDMIDVRVKRKGSKANNYRLCVEPRDRGTICPTDEVIAKIKLIQSSEKELHKVAIRWSASATSWINTSGYCNIVENYR